MDTKRWALRISDKPGVIYWNLGSHFDIWNSSFHDGPIIPLLSSRHVDILSKEEAPVAYARLKAIFRLVNGLSMLTRRHRIFFIEELSLNQGEYIEMIDIEHDRTIMLQELINPFDEEIVDKIDKEKEKGYHLEPKDYIEKEKNRCDQVFKSIDYAELVVKDDLVREGVLLLSLAIEDELYLLVNAYKILELIRTDLGFRNNNGKLVENEISNKYSFENLFELQRYAGYMNNKSASGVLSRHTTSKKDKKFDIPKHDHLMDIVIKSVSEWINYKCITQFKREYSTSEGLLKIDDQFDF